VELTRKPAYRGDRVHLSSLIVRIQLEKLANLPVWYALVNEELSYKAVHAMYALEFTLTHAPRPLAL
jgi:hypothetical protein